MRARGEHQTSIVRFLSDDEIPSNTEGEMATKAKAKRRVEMPGRRGRGRRGRVRAHAENENGSEVPFGQRKGDVVMIGVGMLTVPFGLHKGLTLAGFDGLKAGNIVQAVVIGGVLLTWTGSYVYRVLTQQMTYNKQLRDYEEAVLQKRLEELPESELETLMEEVEAEKQSQQQHGSQQKD